MTRKGHLPRFRRSVVTAAVAGVVGMAIAAIAPGAASPAMSGRAPKLVAGTPAAFEYLAGQTSNRCGLTAAALARYPLSRRLQGSCCFPMDLSTYEWQVRGLHGFASVVQIPRDPYDVPVSLVRQLLSYDRSISLSRAQHSTYTSAMAMSRLRGPCCCHCWRWTAFRGMSKYLIAERSWPARRLAVLIDDLEGCGGKDTPPTATSI